MLLRNVRVVEHNSVTKINGKEYPYKAWRIRYIKGAKSAYKFFPYTKEGYDAATAFVLKVNKENILRTKEAKDSLKGCKKSKGYDEGGLRGIFFAVKKDKYNDYPTIIVEIEKGKKKIKKTRTIKANENGYIAIDEQIDFLVKLMGWNPNCKEVSGRIVNTRANLHKNYLNWIINDLKAF